MKKAKVKKSSDGLYDVIYPNGNTRWFYTKQEAEHAKEMFNKNQK